MVKNILSIKPKGIIYGYFLVSLLIAFIWLLQPFSDYTKSNLEKPTDFIAFVTGASVVKDGQVRELYSREVQISHQNKLLAPGKMNGLMAFRSPPITAYLYVPLLYLDPIVAFYIQAAISILLLFLSVWLIRITFHLSSDVFWLCTSTILVFLPFRTAILGGQVSVLMLFILCLSIYFSKHSRYFLSGVLLGLLFLKVNLLVAAPFFFFIEYLQNKHSLKSLISGFILSLFVIVGINLLIYGPSFLAVYPKFLFLSASVPYGEALFRNSNPISVMSLLTENRTYIFGGAAFVCLVLAGVFLDLFRKTKNYDLLYATVPALGLFLNLHTMNCDLVLLTLSIFILGNYYFKKAKNDAAGVLKCFGVILLFNISTWIAICDLQILGWPTMLLFFYLTLRGSTEKLV